MKAETRFFWDRLWENVAEPVLDAVFPSNIYCLCCGSLIDRTRPYALCDRCVRHLRWAGGPACEKCGKRLQSWWSGSRCADCLTRRHLFERGFICVEYGLYEKRILGDFKYRGRSYYGRKLAELMAERLWAADFLPDRILPVPMHPKKQRQRGYNQAALLAAGIGRTMGIPVEQKLLRRIRNTRPMSRLSREDRSRNMEGAFALAPGSGRERIRGKTLLLVDDIFTTGSTLDQCAQVLKEEGGAAAVYAACFAAGSNRLRPEEEEQDQ